MFAFGPKGATSHRSPTNHITESSHIHSCIKSAVQPKRPDPSTGTDMRTVGQCLLKRTCDRTRCPEQQVLHHERQHRPPPSIVVKEHLILPDTYLPNMLRTKGHQEGKSRENVLCSESQQQTFARHTHPQTPANYAHTCYTC